jgi:tRNA threonylcarbamoyladenosine biosynthesis protein TsaE
MTTGNFIDITYGEQEISAVADAVLASCIPQEGATVVSLTGELGTGKTTLVQSIGRRLGVTENMVSPTFVIMKKYHTTHEHFRTLYHLDAYRIEDIKELTPLGWEKIITEAGALVMVEWGERIEAALPKSAQHFTLEHEDTQRRIYAH